MIVWHAQPGSSTNFRLARFEHNSKRQVQQTALPGNWRKLLKLHSMIPCIEHCRDTVRLCTAQGCSAVGHCKDFLRVGTAGILCGSAFGNSEDTLLLGMFCGWALPGWGTVGILCGSGWGGCGWAPPQVRDTVRLGTAGNSAV